MTERAKKYLFDILQSISLVEEYVEGVPNLAAYVANRMRRDAVERQLGIIGEAVNQYRREPDAAPLTDSRQIVQLRNRLIHSYDSVQHPVIWTIVRDDLPALRAEVAALLAAA